LRLCGVWVLRRRGNWRSLCPRRGGGCLRRRRAGGNHGSARSGIVSSRACLLGLRWTSQKPKGKQGAKDDCCRVGDFFHSAKNTCRKTQKHRLGNVTISTHQGVCLRGAGGGFLDRINRIYRIGGFLDRMTGFAGGTGRGGGRWRSFRQNRSSAENDCLGQP
jgi:hypothetical protein